MPVFYLSKDLIFPPPDLSERDGLLAVGGDLAVPRLLLAYKMGIFPWYSPGDPILWWSPDPRMVLHPEDLHVSRSLAKCMRKSPFSVTLDTAFEAVIRSCAAVRTEGGEETWLTEEMIFAYTRLHKEGYAHSVESWDENGNLAGGLYGVSLGRSFFGESMFARASNASKVAFVSLVRQLDAWDFDLVDCQVQTDHLSSLGGEPISRRRFLSILSTSLAHETLKGPWAFDTDPVIRAS